MRVKEAALVHAIVCNTSLACKISAWNEKQLKKLPKK